MMDDEIRIQHIKDSIDEIKKLKGNKNFKTFSKNRTIQLALVQLLEIIGEAACSISSEFQIKHPELPWNEIIGMRNRLIHRYFDIDIKIVWKTIIDDIPILEELIKKISK